MFSSRASWLDPVMAIGVAAATLLISIYFAPRGYQAGFVDMAHDGYQLRQARELGPRKSIFPAQGLNFRGCLDIKMTANRFMAKILGLGPDVSLAPKKGYVSLRRPRKQFAMIQPSGAGRIDLGLILPGVPAAGRLEPSGSFNALFTHRVRVTSGGDLDDALAEWLAAAYAAAG